eukprot:gnl/Trimastix_PCT/2783.p1 GENE.gnl/Trimastix_PCT/2783~~gnl/Trimastix_PCT/2783.p1  ORF type:complete len:383 (+),score=122.39 gnl/Trimastix_PCT/2783:44-1150(+)
MESPEEHSQRTFLTQGNQQPEPEDGGFPGDDLLLSGGIAGQSADHLRLLERRKLRDQVQLDLDRKRDEFAATMAQLEQQHQLILEKRQLLDEKEMEVSATLSVYELRKQADAEKAEKDSRQRERIEAEIEARKVELEAEMQRQRRVLASNERYKCYQRYLESVVEYSASTDGVPGIEFRYNTLVRTQRSLQATVERNERETEARKARHRDFMQRTQRRIYELHDEIQQLQDDLKTRNQEITDIDQLLLTKEGQLKEQKELYAYISMTIRNLSKEAVRESASRGEEKRKLTLSQMLQVLRREINDLEFITRNQPDPADQLLPSALPSPRASPDTGHTHRGAATTTTTQGGMGAGAELVTIPSAHNLATL